MLTEGNHNTAAGQFQEFVYMMEEHVRLRMADKYIYIQDETDADVIRFALDGGLLKYSIYSGGAWQPDQTLTSTAISPEDSTTLPHAASNTRIDISGDQFRVYLQNTLYMQLTTAALTAKLSRITVDNATYDLALELKGALGQRLVVRDSDTGTDMLSVSASSVNTHNKPVIGVSASTDATSAVPLSTLQSYQPQALRARVPSNSAVIYSTQQLPIAEFTSNDVVLTKPARYNPRPGAFQNTTLTDVQQVNAIVADYQALTEKDQPLGYAGLDTDGRIYSNRVPLSTTILQAGVLQSASGAPVSTSAVVEGSNLYYTDSRVNTFVDTLKGVPNGLCPLNASAKVPAQFIDSLSLGGTFSGLDAQKTNQLNPAYSASQPTTGDQYIATDTGSVYILKGDPFTSAGNWILLTQGGVTSVNGFQGIVSLSTDTIGEGVTNKYFYTGIQNYKTATANQANELLKLDAQGHFAGSYLGTEVTLQGGFATIQDNQTSHMRIVRASDQDVLLEVDNAGVVLGRKAAYDVAPVINSNLDIPHKQYVDQVVAAYVPVKIQDADTEVTASSADVTTTVQTVDVQVITQSQIQANVPVVYDGVSVTQAQQLATKQYVDNTLANFINVSGAAKQYLQATSNVPITTNGRITNWNVNIQSAESSRLSLNPATSTFAVKNKTYRFYLGIQIKEFTEVDLVQINVQLRDANTLQAYFYYDFSNDFSSTGGDQALSMSLPFIWNFAGDTELEVYVQSSQASFGVYNAYIMIEEFQNYEFAIGADRITDPGAFSKLQIASHTLDFNLNGADKMQLTTSALVLEPGIRVLQDSSTANTDPLQLVPKAYVDEQVNLANVSISKTGQVIQVGMSSNQVIQVGQTVLFDTQQLNTSLTMTVASGLFTFVQGFVYKITYKVVGRFLNGGTAQVVLRDAATLQTVPGSIVYMTYNSQDTSSTSAQFFLDLRAEVASKSYNLILLSATNLQQVYKNYSLFQAEQVQIINDLFFDRIETPGQVSQIKLYQEELNYKLDGSLIAIASNVSGDFQTELQTANKSFAYTSTSDSTTVSSQTILKNGTNGVQRSAELVTAVDQDVAISIKADVSSGDVPSVSITAPLADRLDIGTSNVALHITDQYTTSNQLIVYDNAVVPTNAKHLVPKEYVDDNFYADTVTLDQIAAPMGSVDLNGQKITSLGDATAATDALNRQTGDARYYLNTTALNSITAPTGSLSMNSQKITSLGTPTANTDAATKLYVDQAVTGGGSINQIANSVNANSNLTANQTEVTNGSTPLNLNSQKITSLADATAATDALNRQTGDGRYYLNTTTLNSITAPTAAVSLNSQKITSLATPTANADAATKLYVDTVNQSSSLGYMVFSVIVPDVASAPSSYTSTNNFITGITFTQGSNLGRGYYAVAVDTTKVFGGEDYYIMYSVRSLRGSLSDVDNDLAVVVTSLYSKSSFTFLLEETSSQATNMAIDGILFRRTNIQNTLPANALTQEQGDARYYANNRYYAFKILLGDVPFTSGSTNTVYALTINGTNVPVNQSSIITAVDWVRQSARTDTVRLRLTLSNAIINQRPYQVMLTPETVYANASGGPTAEWQFGSETENFVLQTFNIDYSSSPKFFIHARDIAAASTQSLIVNGLILITEAVNTIAPVVSELPYYAFSIEIGDVPSAEDAYYSTNNVVTNVVYANMSSSAGRWAVYINSASVFSGSDYYVLLQVRSLRGSTSTTDNDIATPIVSEYYKTYFVFYMEETGSVVQNVAIDGILMKR